MRIAALILGIIGALVIWGISSFGAILGVTALNTTAGTALLVVSYAIPIAALVGATLALRFPLLSGIMLLGSGLSALALVGVGPVSIGVTALVLIAGVFALIGVTEKPTQPLGSGEYASTPSMSRGAQFLILGVLLLLGAGAYVFSQGMAGKRFLRSLRGTPSIAYSSVAQPCFSQDAANLNAKSMEAQATDLGIALGYLNEALAIEPDCAALLFRRSEILDSTKRYDEAMVDINAALEWEPDNSYFLISRGTIEANMKKYDAAIRDFSHALKFRRDSRALNNRCNATSALYPRDPKKLNEALTDCNEAITLQPTALRITTRCQVQLLRGDFRAALSDCSQAISLNPQPAQAHYNPQSAQAYYLRGLIERRTNVPQGDADIAHAFELDPHVNEDFDSIGITKDFVLSLKPLPNGSPNDSGPATVTGTP